jgi:hypothetical protein
MLLRRLRTRVVVPKWLIGATTQQTALDITIQILIVLGLIGISGGIVYSTGGLPNAYAHLFYIPILLASYYFGVSGAIVSGILSGIVAGPMSGLLEEPQSTASWATRMAFFVGIGITANLMFASRNRNRSRLRHSIRELYQAYGKSLQTFASLVALRDEQTAYHCERVAHNARVLGEEVGMSEHDLTELHWSGILHDLGKISTPSRILLKPGSLTDSEYGEIRKHVEIGADILAGISPRFLNIAEGVRTHHEWWDGTGYPRRLRGEQIPLSGRILGIVDVFEAITSERPYREPMETEDALALIRAAAGSHFDPKLVKIFLDLHDRGLILTEGDPIPKSSLDEYPLPGYATLAEQADTT